jgi:hypothetical protein
VGEPWGLPGAIGDDLIGLVGGLKDIWIPVFTGGVFVRVNGLCTGGTDAPDVVPGDTGTGSVDCSVPMSWSLSSSSGPSRELLRSGWDFLVPLRTKRRPPTIWACPGVLLDPLAERTFSVLEVLGVVGEAAVDLCELS